MSSDDQPAQPLTDAELMEINYNLNEALNRCGELYLVTDAPKDMRRLLVEVDRLRSALTALGRNEQAAANRSLELQEENERIRGELEERTTQWRALLNLRERDAKDYRELKARMDQLQDEIEEYRQNV